MPAFTDHLGHLRFAVSQARPNGVAIELGVYKGTTLRVIREAYAGKVYGFDSFQGLPQDWREDYPAGTFAVDSIPKVDGATIVVGMFHERLPEILPTLNAPVTFIHFDCDLYSSTTESLAAVTEYLDDRVVFCFDEYEGYDGWEQHEHRAFVEWLSAHPSWDADDLAWVDGGQQRSFRLERVK